MASFYNSENEIEILLEGFNTKTLPKEQWTHEAHLTGAVWFLSRYDYDEALALIRKAIAEYNIAVGGQNTPTSGYHETMTVFWMSVVCFFVEKHEGKNLFHTCNALLASPLADKNLPFYFYERDTILSPIARAVYVAPDKTILNHDTLNDVLQHDTGVASE